MKNLFPILITFLTLSVFSQNAETIKTNSLLWQHNQTIIDPQAIYPSGFGNAISINGTDALVGDFWNKVVYYYKFDDLTETWIYKQTIEQNHSSSFGQSVCISNNTAFISDPRFGNDIGAVFIYNIDPVSGIWVYKQTLTLLQASPGDYFGNSISVDNGVAVIGAIWRKNQAQLVTGAAFIFVKNDSTWVQDCEVVCTQKQEGDKFGTKVSIDGYNIAVSAIRHDYPGRADVGSVFTFRYNALNHTTSPVAEIIPPTQGSPFSFGCSLKLKGNMIIVGAGGPVYGQVFAYNKLLDPTFVKPQFLEGNNNGNNGYGDNFGWSLDFDENNLVIGAYIDEIQNDFAAYGSVYFYDLVGTSWRFKQKEKISCYGTGGAAFGNCVSLSPDYCLIGQSYGIWDVQGKQTSISSSKMPATSKVFFLKKGQGLTADAGQDQTACKGDVTDLGGSPTALLGNGSYKYFWTDNNGWTSDLENPVVSPLFTTTYYLTVM